VDSMETLIRASYHLEIRHSAYNEVTPLAILGFAFFICAPPSVGIYRALARISW